MDWAVLLCSRVLLLAAVAGVVACEPIVLSPWAIAKPPDAGAVDDDPDVDDAGADGGEPTPGEDAGEDGGEPTPGEDGGADGGPGDAGDAGGVVGNDGPVLGDGGVDVRMSEWSGCDAGWQQRTVLPTGTKGYGSFALDADGDAYFIEHTDDILRVGTTKPWRTFPRTGWLGPQPYVVGVRVGPTGEVHVALSPRYLEGDTDVPVHFLRYTAGRWVHTVKPGGLLWDLEVDSRGHLHAMSTWIGPENRLLYTHGPPDALVVEETGLVLDDDIYRASLQLDARGHAHVAFIPRKPRGIHYATNASGAWVEEPVSSQGDDGYLALSPSGTPYIAWMDSTHIMLASRDAQTGWTAVSVGDERASMEALAVSPTGVVHLLLTVWDGSPLHLSNASGGWVRTRLGPEPLGFPPSATGSSMELDSQGRAHVMHTWLKPDEVSGRPLRTMDSYRQCQ
ncbi:hypothetical protein [Myxococcus sp. AS-1-15]|uniref:hypothetical protein n=1 Tax=Myxococcus sp. AS-1-15 TaxID=2874600 RepID=UPI001CBEA6A6|nr:hypothetical protein [Myxococcus sp. AS-1-15]MBZ4396379.1 hypothetical protein [Myxococcus sp. AS-1-15]